MRRVLATMRCDVVLQLRNGFYYAVAFVLACWAVVLTQVPSLDWAWLMPVFVFGNLAVVSFYFIGGLVLLEKDEGTLEAQVVTPLGRGEYLTSKVATLTALSLVENLLLVCFAVGAHFALLPMTAGIVLASVLYALVGFVAVARYDSINEYIMPSMVYVLLLSVPYLGYFGIWRSPLLYLHPLQGPLMLMEAAFRPIPFGTWAYAVAYPVLAALVGFWWSREAFDRFIVSRQGAH
jgi:fluoroquinolone transport system permease protein